MWSLFIYIFCINTLITIKNPYITSLLLQTTVWQVKVYKREDRALLGGLGRNWKNVFTGKLTHTTTAKILSVSPLTRNYTSRFVQPSPRLHLLKQKQNENKKQTKKEEKKKKTKKKKNTLERRKISF